jgi:epsilon-lactone hydrolase
VEEPADVIPISSAPEGVEVRHLRAFVAVAEELNFSRAAARLYLSQPALSRQIRALERALGCELLKRSTHSVELTLAGEALLDRARVVLAALDEAIATAQAVGGEMSARIMRLWAPVAAVAPVASVQQMREVFEAFLAETPMPPDVAVRAVTAGGVPGLVVGDAPSVLYLHGGGYMLGSAYGYRSLVAALVNASGAAALVPDYRLAPEHPFPAPVHDALAAYRWLAERRDPSEILLAGDSSAAGLVLALLQRLRTSHEQMPAGAVLLCPVVDLSGGMLVPGPETHPLDVMRQNVEAYLAGHPLRDPLISPLDADLSGLPPLLIQCGEDDRARPEAEALADRARQHGVYVRLSRYPTEVHVFQVFWSFLPQAQQALAEAGDFIRDAAAGPGETRPDHLGA